jgi:D-3-phosphoglycerate dehydrogenase
MKAIFIDCNKQLAPVFARVSRSDDPPIAVNGDAFSSRDLPHLLAGYDICLDDHSYMPTEAMAECRGLAHIVFLGTGASRSASRCTPSRDMAIPPRPSTPSR